MSVRLAGSSSGYTELDAQASPGNNVIKMPANNGTAGQRIGNGATAGTLEFADNIVSGTAVASTSGTSIDFTGIPSWVKRVTVMFNGVSTNGASALLVQLGTSGGIEATGYSSTVVGTDTGAIGTGSSTTGMVISTQTASDAKSGLIQLCTLGLNSWACSHTLKLSTTQTSYGAGNKTLSGTLDRIRVTTVGGTDQFDAGTINILYE